MRLVTFSRAGTQQPEIGVRILRQGEDVAKGRILSLAQAARLAGATPLPATMRGLLAEGPPALDRARALAAAALADPSKFASAIFEISSITWLPPITDAEKFLCVGKNYRKHLEELKRTDLIREIPEEPTSFI
jgi:5-carboxymethyl-2-hydroxymuconate isomerase/acylpyruvate hydrolase